MANNAIIEIVKRLRRLERKVRKTQITGFQRPTWLAAPLTSVAWDGDGYSTTAKTVIDLSVIFGAPANIKAVLMFVRIRDSGSAGTSPWIVIGPTNVAASGPAVYLGGVANDELRSNTMVVPCDANGDIYYQINASAAGNMDVWLQIWGYWL